MASEDFSDCIWLGDACYITTVQTRPNAERDLAMEARNNCFGSEHQSFTETVRSELNTMRYGFKRRVSHNSHQRGTRPMLFAVAPRTELHGNITSFVMTVKPCQEVAFICTAFSEIPMDIEYNTI